jgi:protein-tyrosine sulfotransferase
MSVDELSNRPAEPAKNSPNGPIIVMAYAGSEADQLRSALSAFPELACTQRTGILPLFHHALTTWQTVDGNAGGGVSPLASASLRALSAGLMTAILTRQGGRRWCEFTSGATAAAQSFAGLYPQARFLISYCRADTAVRAIIGSSRWGLEGPEFAPYVSAFPASPVAALASYWAAHTAQQLEFEQAHPDKCHRVRVEDLTANPAQALLDISEFLALDDGGMAPSFLHDDGPSQPAGEGAPATGLPIDRIPASLLARVNELHRSLGYPPVTAEGA